MENRSVATALSIHFFNNLVLVFYEDYLELFPGLMFRWIKVYFFELLLHDVSQVRLPAGKDFLESLAVVINCVRGDARGSGGDVSSSSIK